ncbi:MAG: hypothetical protein KF766_06550 [Rhodocyclaceae bacterium]|nr:hypothetical protein [Rhodocyclaceae bacterium]
MGSGANIKNDNGVNYVASFKDKFFGVGCTIEVVVDMSTMDSTARLAMKQMLSSNPAFSISLEDLKAISACIRSVQNYAPLLDTLVEGAIDQQLYFVRNGAMLIVVHPKGQSARFTLSIGLFQREGTLQELSSNEIDEVVTKIDAIMAKVVAKIGSVSQ